MKKTLSTARFIALTQEKIDAIFESAKIASDYVLALYLVAMPDFYEYKSIFSFPTVNRKTGNYIMQKAIDFGKLQGEGFPGGQWFNSGFSAPDNSDIPDWKIDKSTIQGTKE